MPSTDHGTFITGHIYRYCGPNGLDGCPNTSPAMCTISNGDLLVCTNADATHIFNGRRGAQSFDRIEGAWHWEHLFGLFEDMGMAQDYATRNARLSSLKKGDRLRVFGMEASVVIPPTKRHSTLTILLKSSLQIVPIHAVEEVLDA